MQMLRYLLNNLVNAQGMNKVCGQPFKISEIVTAIRDRLEK